MTSSQTAKQQAMIASPQALQQVVAQAVAALAAAQAHPQVMVKLGRPARRLAAPAHLRRWEQVAAQV